MDNKEYMLILSEPEINAIVYCIKTVQLTGTFAELEEVFLTIRSIMVKIDTCLTRTKEQIDDK